MKYLLLITVLFFGPSSFAASICTDLAAHTCAQREPDDGTGKSKLVDPLSFINSELARIRPRLVTEFTKLISGSTGAELRALAIQAFNFEEEKACLPSSNNSNCVSLLVDRMIESYKLKEFGREVMSDAYFFSGDSIATGRLLSDTRYFAVVKKIAEEQKALVPQTLLENIEKNIFPKTKDLLKARIKSMSISSAQKVAMLEKIDSATYEGANCESLQDDASGIAPAFIPNAFYNPETNSFQFCLGYLRISDSEFNIVHTIAHELSHSIDPCRISEGDIVAPASQRKSDAKVDDTYLKKNFLKCLRSKESIGAKRLQDDTPMPMSATEALVYNDTHRLCGGDELNEAVPDWFAAEVVAEYSEIYFKNLTRTQKQAGFANILRPTCNETRFDGSQHPKSTDRLNGLILVQPKIRTEMGCVGDAPKRYCDIDNPASLVAHPKKEKPLKHGSQKSKNKAVK